MNRSAAANHPADHRGDHPKNPAIQKIFRRLAKLSAPAEVFLWPTRRPVEGFPPVRGLWATELSFVPPARLPRREKFLPVSEPCHRCRRNLLLIKELSVWKRNRPYLLGIEDSRRLARRRYPATSDTKEKIFRQ